MEINNIIKPLKLSLDLCGLLEFNKMFKNSKANFDIYIYVAKYPFVHLVKSLNSWT